MHCSSSDSKSTSKCTVGSWMKRLIVVCFCPGCGDFTLHLGHAGEEPSPVGVQEIPETAGGVGAVPGPFSPESPGEVTHPATGPVPV